jgi:hypothetical protein
VASSGAPSQGPGGSGQAPQACAALAPEAPLAPLESVSFAPVESVLPRPGNPDISPAAAGVNPAPQAPAKSAGLSPAAAGVNPAPQAPARSAGLSPAAEMGERAASPSEASASLNIAVPGQLKVLYLFAGVKRRSDMADAFEQALLVAYWQAPGQAHRGRLRVSLPRKHSCGWGAFGGFLGGTVPRTGWEWPGPSGVRGSRAGGAPGPTGVRFFRPSGICIALALAGQS